MPTVVPIDQSLIANYIKSRGWRYLTDSDGDMLVNFSADAETDEWSVYFMLTGQNKDIYQLSIQSRKTYPKSQWPQIVLVCNEWNKNRRWPRAYLDIPDKEGVTETHVILDTCIDFEKGVHQELFEDFTNTILSGAMRFWKWAREEHGM
jgi:Putative bacterial sensory transduction regulator